MPTQQFTLYDAEETTGHGRTFASLAEIQTYVDELRDTEWWSRLYWMIAKVEVGTSRKWHESVGWFDRDKNAGRMEMGHRHRTELDVLHELSHVLAKARHGSDSHDPTFARTYLETVYLVRGSDAYLELQAAFDRAGIDYGREATS